MVKKMLIYMIMMCVCSGTIIMFLNTTVITIIVSVTLLNLSFFPLMISTLSLVFSC